MNVVLVYSVAMCATLITCTTLLSKRNFQFQFKKYTADIPENTRSGYHILTLSTFKSPNSIVRYKLHPISNPPDTTTNLFHLDDSTGVLSLADDNLIDYEQQPVYKMIVTAHSINEHSSSSSLSTSGGSGGTAFADLIINVIDQNDCAPVIQLVQWNDGHHTTDFDISISELLIVSKSTTTSNTVSSITPTYNLEIWENQRIPELALINVYDADSGINAQTTLTTNDTSRFHTELLHRSGHLSTFALKLTYTIDREMEPIIYLKLTAFDHGLPSIRTTQTITITILDENDCAPAFEKTEINLSIYENNEANMIVTNVTAIDPDIDQQNIQYLMEHEAFAIDESNGEIRTLVQLDRERIPYYELNVKAIDKHNLKYSSALIHVQVLDRNDNPPIFDRGAYVFLFPTRTQIPPQSIFGEFNVYDLDEQENAEYIISIPDANSSQCFAISAEGHNILYLKHGCHEWNRIEEISFIVSATNTRWPYHQSNASVALKHNLLNPSQPLPLIFDVSEKNQIVVDADLWTPTFCNRTAENVNIQPYMGWLVDKKCGLECRYKPLAVHGRHVVHVDVNGKVTILSLAELETIINKKRDLKIERLNEEHNAITISIGDDSTKKRSRRRLLIMSGIVGPAILALFTALLIGVAIMCYKVLSVFDNLRKGLRSLDKSTNCVIYDNIDSTISHKSKSPVSSTVILTSPELSTTNIGASASKKLIVKESVNELKVQISATTPIVENAMRFFNEPSSSLSSMEMGFCDSSDLSDSFVLSRPAKKNHARTSNGNNDVNGQEFISKEFVV